MANIWQPPPGGYRDGPGLVCIGSLDTNPDHPWGRTNPWAYDGAIYGYREFADTPFGGVQYSVLGSQMSVCIADPGPTAADKLAQVAILNGGCNADPFGVDLYIINAFDTSTPDVDWATTIECDPTTADIARFIKASMPVWGIVRDVLSNNALGQEQVPLTYAFTQDGASPSLRITFATEAANDLWWQTLIPEFITLWTEH